MLPRFAALAALLISTVFAQGEAASVPNEPAGVQLPGTPAAELKVDETDPMVRRAYDNLEQVRKLVSLGALPAIRLQKSQEDVEDARDMSILRKNLYDANLLPEQIDEMVLIAEKMVLRRQRSISQTQELLAAGVISRAEAEATNGDLERARSELEAAQGRARLIQQLAEAVKIEKRMASLEIQASSHPEWAGKVFMKYNGSGVFTPMEMRAMESAYVRNFARALPISADGETALHRSFGFDHRGRVDVALNPDQPEGVWLMRYLESKRIPYFAFRMAVPRKATGAHIHVGPESTRLIASE